MTTPILTGNGRVFIHSGLGCDSYQFHNCMKVDAISKPIGESESVYCPSDLSYNEFIEVASIEGTEGRWTSTLTGRLPLDSESVLEHLLRQRCSFNMQVHYGQCNNPSDFSTFDAAFVFQDVKLSSYDLTALTALIPDERATVDESAAITIGNVYRIFTQNYSQLAATSITGHVGNIDICDTKSCGGVCTSRSDGCQIIYTTHQATGNVFQILYSTDGGSTWDIVSTLLDASNNYAPLKCSDNNLYFIIFNGTNSFLYSMAQTDVISGNNDTFLLDTVNSEQIVGFTRGSNHMFYFGGTVDSYISAVNINTNNIIQIDDGTLVTGATVTSGFALDDDEVVLGVSNGTLLVSDLFGAFNSLTITVNGIANSDAISDIHMFNSSHWLVSAGTRILCTVDSGNTWSSVTVLPTAGKFSFYDDVTGYFHNQSGIYRTIDSGVTWTLTQSFSSNFVGGIKACAFNPNTVFASGGTPGSIGDSYVYSGKGKTQVI